MVSRRLSIPILLLLALPLLPLTAQEPAEDAPAPGEETRRLLLAFRFAKEANFSAEEELLLYESLLVHLGSASRRLAVVETPGRAGPASDADRSTLARSLGADSWLRVELDGDWMAVGLDVDSYDLLSQKTVFRFQLTQKLLRGAVDLERDFWDEVVAAAADYYSQAAAAKPMPGQVVFQAVPGSRLRLPWGEVLRAGEEGTARLGVQLPLTLSVRAERAGFFPLENRFYLAQEMNTLELAQERGSRFAFDVYLNNLVFPGFEFSWFFLPSSLYARAGFTTYLAGLLFSDHDEEDSALFVSRSLNLLDLGVGAYLNEADRHLRAYAGLGAFLRLVTSGGYFGLEPVAPWGLQAILGFEYSRRLKQRFYLELDPLLYYTGHRERTELFRAFLPEDQSPVGYLFFPSGVFQLLNIRLGFRWQI